MSRTVNVLPAAQLKPVEFERRHLFINAPAGTVLDDVKDPIWLGHHVKALRRNDLLEIVAEDGALDVTARVVAIAPGMVFLRLLSVWEDASAAEASEDDGEWTVSFAGPQRFRVLAPNGDIYAKDIPTKAEAIALRDKVVAELSAKKAA